MAKEPSIEELVVKEEKKLAEDDRGKNAVKNEGMKLPGILLGAAIYAFGMNFFLRPIALYSGGLMGFAQLFEEFFFRAGINFGGFHISGVLYYLMNIPAILIALKKMRRRFIIKTVIAVTAVSALLALLPIPEAPILDDMITNTIIAGLICGAGTGIILWEGACDGGTTLIGMLVISLWGKSSVGQVSMGVNILLYAIMLFLFDVPTVIYSLVFAVFSSIATDKIHTQNISSQVTVITKLQDTKPMEVEVMSRLYRGMTEINASGTFTGDPVKVFVIFVSKYETSRLRAIIKSYDPQAFIVENEGVRIDGPFLRKIT